MTNLPPLPDPTMEASTLITAGGVFGAMFAVDQMLEYGALCRKLALEEAVKACEAIEREHLDTYKHNPGPNAYDPHYQGLSMGAGECAEKIRELLK